MDPPIPPYVLGALDTAEGDLRLLSFKYAALTAAVGKRPQSPVDTGEGAGVGVGGAGGGAEVAGGEEAEGGLSEDDLRELLEQHVSCTSLSSKL